MPKARAAREGRCSIGVSLHPDDVVHDWLTARGYQPPYSGRIELDLRDLPPSSLDEVTRRLHALGGEMSPALHWFLLNRTVLVNGGHESGGVTPADYEWEAYRANIAEAMENLRQK